MKSYLFPLAIVASLSAAVPATAAVVDFESAGTTQLDQQPDTWSYNGFTFATAGIQYTSFNRPGSGADNGSRYYINGFGTVSIARGDSAAFSISSLDLGLADYTAATEFVTLTGNQAGGGTVSLTVLLDQTFQGFSLSGFDNLTSFSISQPSVTSAYVALDNLTYAAAVGNVPEPASWALMVGGFGLAGAAMRRRRSVTVRFA